MENYNVNIQVNLIFLEKLKTKTHFSFLDNQEMDNNHPSELEPHQYVEIIGATKLTRNPSTRNARKNSLTMLVNRINKLSL